MEDERRPDHWFLPLLIASTAVFKLFLAWRYPGFLTGDDVETARRTPSAWTTRPGSFGGADALAVYERDVSPEVGRFLGERGFARCRRFQQNAGLAVVVYLPVSRPCPRPRSVGSP